MKSLRRATYLTLLTAIFAAGWAGAGGHETARGPVVGEAHGTPALGVVVAPALGVPVLPSQAIGDVTATAALGSSEQAQAPADATQATALESVRALSERLAAGPEGKDAAAKSEGAPQGALDQTYDNRGKIGNNDDAVVAKPSLLRRLLGRYAPQPKPKISTRFDRDEFGGPPKLQDQSKKGILLYGAKWGASMAGLATILQVVLTPVTALLQFPGSLPSSWLPMIGRVELLTSYGPKQIAEGLAASPTLFLTLTNALSVFKEEFLYRGVELALLFAVLTGLARLLGVTGEALSKLPNMPVLSGIGHSFKTMSQTRRIFPAAAAIASLSFAAAHFGAWGFNPVLLAVHVTLGYALAHVAYAVGGWKGLLASATAHFVYNSLMLIGVLAALQSAAMGSAVAVAVGVGSIAALYWHRRSYQRAVQDAEAQAKVSFKGMAAGLAALLIAGAALVGLGGTREQVSAVTVSRPALTLPAQWPAKKIQAAPQEEAPKATPKAEEPQDEHTERLKEKEMEARLNEFMRMFGAQLPKDPATLSGYAKITATIKNSVGQVITTRGTGSSSILTADGLAVTNNHVIDGHKVVIVSYPDGTRVRAKVVAANAGKDIAFLQLPPKEGGWTPVPLGDSDDLSEGDEVLAGGYPRGLEFTITKGIISGLGGDHRRNLYVRHLQTDAAINPGNSGGPLFNMKGEQVGMNTHILTGGANSMGSIGLGFSITAKDIKTALEQFKATGNIDSGWLGVLSDSSDPLKPELGLPLEYIRPGSPAEKAGLRPGDVLMGAEGRPFAAAEQAVMQLGAMLAHARPGQVLTFAVAREGDILFIPIPVGAEK